MDLTPSVGAARGQEPAVDAPDTASPMGGPAAAAWPDGPLPHPFSYEGGKHPCNEALIDTLSGRTVGYCLVPVAHFDRWRRPAGTHRGEHMITWANTTTN